MRIVAEIMGIQKPLKKATNLTLDEGHLDDAKALGINISQEAQKRGAAVGLRPMVNLNGERFVILTHYLAAVP